jgi:aminoglycoside phosphotransferase (APT) family kinase protein
VTLGGAAGGAGGREVVVRKKPPGKILRGAHAVEREFAVLAALGGAGFPVPRPLLLCQDESVLGTSFYVMDFVRGDSPRPSADAARPPSPTVPRDPGSGRLCTLEAEEKARRAQGCCTRTLTCGAWHRWSGRGCLTK